MFSTERYARKIETHEASPGTFALIFTVSDHEVHNDSLWTYIIGTYIIGQRAFASMSYILSLGQLQDWESEINLHTSWVESTGYSVGKRFKSLASSRDFRGGPVVRTLDSRGPAFNPWSWNYIPHGATKNWCSQINKKL